MALTAVLIWFGTGLHPRWPLLWLAPLPVLLLAANASRSGAAIAAAAAWLLGACNLWHYLHGALHVPAAVVVVVFGTEALVFTLAVLLHRALLRRGAVGWAIVAFAATRVAFEYLLNGVSPHGTAGSLAYSQLEFLPFLQLASVTGPWGMTFVVLLFPAALAAAWQVRGTRRRALGILGAALGVIAVVLGFGAVRLARDASGPMVKVGLIASDPPTSPEVADDGAATAALLDAYATRASALAAQGVQVIVLPEKLGVVVDSDTRDRDARFQRLADQTGAMIVVGLIRVAPPVKYNEARIYAPGERVQRYDKQHLLPPFESPFRPGSELALLARPTGTWGVAICKDMDFTPLSRDYGRAGVAVMLVPAWDFVLDGFFHGHMAVMRGVESGFGVVRAAKQGYLTVSDDRGRILAETASDAAPFATLLVEVPTTHAPTLYLRLGDWFAWLALAGLAAALVQLARLRSKSRPAASRRTS
ncbi:MAG TPA: nitrilase-related carbon-nitrogen hydrolase [Kofleriaceae bacterium]